MTNTKEIDVLGFSDETIEWWFNLADEHGEDVSDLDEKERKELTMWRRLCEEILGDSDIFKQKYNVENI